MKVLETVVAVAVFLFVGGVILGEWIMAYPPLAQVWHP